MERQNILVRQRLITVTDGRTNKDIGDATDKTIDIVGLLKRPKDSPSIIQSLHLDPSVSHRHFVNDGLTSSKSSLWTSHSDIFKDS